MDGAELARQHRALQLLLRTGTLRNLLQLWSLYDINDLNRTWPGWSLAVAAVVAHDRRQSAALAAIYLAQARRLALPDESPPPAPVVPEVDPGRMKALLEITAIAGVKRAINAGRSAKDAMDIGFVLNSGEMTKLVMEGGRHTVLAAITSDARAQGYHRVTAAKACEFCRGLAGKFHSRSADRIDFQAHAHCSCATEIVYS